MAEITRSIPHQFTNKRVFQHYYLFHTRVENYSPYICSTHVLDVHPLN